MQLAVNCALESGVFDQVILSSDSLEILNIVETNPLVIKHHRDPLLATDNCRADEVVRNIVREKEIEENKIVCCLLPTTPLLSSIDLSTAYSEISLSNFNSDVLFGITESIETPFRSFVIDAKMNLVALFPDELNLQSNDYPKTYTDAGQFYFASAETWMKNYSITATPSSKGYLLDSSKCIDINTIDDWHRFLRENPEIN